MSSAWGASWYTSWGDAWGPIAPPTWREVVRLQSRTQPVVALQSWIVE